MSPDLEAPIEGGAAAETAAKSERRPVLRGMWSGITHGVLGLVLLLACVTILVPKLVGGVPLTILSGSMEPTIAVGSLAVVRPVEPAEIRVGDVVTYLPNADDPTAITHRVVAIENHQGGSRTFTTQGDANTVPDAPVQGHQIRAKVWYTLPGLGYVNTAVNGEHQNAVISAAAGGFFLWAVSLWRGAWKTRAERRTPDAAQRVPSAAGAG